MTPIKAARVAAVIVAACLVMVVGVVACASTTTEATASTEVANVAPLTPAEYKALAFRLDTDRCWQAILELKPYADMLGTPLICGNADYEGVENAGLYFDGVARVAITGDPSRWFQLVGSHELGHAWDEVMFGADDVRLCAMAVLGWNEWDSEGWARVYQAGIGYWDDDDHPNISKPSTVVLDTLRYAGLLP